MMAQRAAMEIRCGQVNGFYAGREMESVPDVGFANAPAGCVAGDDDGPKARGDSPLKQFPRERPILVNIDLKPEGP